jgi:hypothetical protein
LDIHFKKKTYFLFLLTGAAGSCRAGGTAARGRLEPAASSSYAKRRKNFLYIFAAAGCAGDGFLLSHRDKAFKVPSALFADKLINWHSIILHHFI